MHSISNIQGEAIFKPFLTHWKPCQRKQSLSGWKSLKYSKFQQIPRVVFFMFFFPQSTSCCCQTFRIPGWPAMACGWPPSLCVSLSLYMIPIIDLLGLIPKKVTSSHYGTVNVYPKITTLAHLIFCWCTWQLPPQKKKNIPVPSSVRWLPHFPNLSMILGRYCKHDRAMSSQVNPRGWCNDPNRSAIVGQLWDGTQAVQQIRHGSMPSLVAIFSNDMDSGGRKDQRCLFCYYTCWLMFHIQKWSETTIVTSHD